ncbi:hypothetical protein [Leptospirillum ferriphilum]|uniref:hypothetical protein n=1 Tax=Leptospirillum ferriphilum TaxID=178606 RepID=UPI0015C3B047|nr:hypothetical protein [Leptospirillum ferriphilum]
MRGTEETKTGAMGFDMFEIGLRAQKTDPAEKAMDLRGEKRLAASVKTTTSAFSRSNR